MGCDCCRCLLVLCLGVQGSAGLSRHCTTLHLVICGRITDMNTGMRAQAEYADTMTLDSYSSTSMTLWHFLHSQVADLGPEELLSEFRALQELALASYSSKGDGPTDSTCASDQKAKCKMNTETEEFLLQQVIASSDEKLQVSALTVVFGSEF